MGCQTKIAQQIILQQADYVVGLKGHQSDLHQSRPDLVCGPISQLDFNVIQEVDKGHGRLEAWRCAELCPLSGSDFDQPLLRRRSLIGTVFDELKNLCQIEHTRHRPPFNFTVNLLSGIIAYCLFPNKPKLPLQHLRSDSLIPNLYID